MVRLFFLNSGEEELVLVDTGCTWNMIIDRQQAEIQRLEKTSITTRGTVASGESRVFEIWTAKIRWFGAEKRIRVHVPEPLEGVRVQSRSPRKDDDPVALIGTSLLEKTHLFADFRDNTLRISL